MKMVLSDNSDWKSIDKQKMKIFHAILILGLIVTACTYKPRIATIELTVSANTKDDVFYIPLSDNFNYNSFPEKIITDSTGKTTITFNISSPGITRIICSHNEHRIIVEPGRKYEVVIDDGQITLTGQKSEAQVFLEGLSHTHPRSFEFFENETSNFDSVLENINEKLASEIAQLHDVSCSEIIRDIIITERQVYYSLATATLASIHNLQFWFKKEPTPVSIMNVWRETTETFPAANNAQWYFDLQELSLWYHIYTNCDPDEFIKVRAQKREEDLVHSHTLELAWEFLPEHGREFFTATYLKTWGGGMEKYEKELIGLIEGFSNDFPRSPYLKSLASDKEAVEKFHQLAAQEWKDEWKLMDYHKINTLEDALLPLRGKMVYVDIWTTTCGWCKKEFAHNDPLKLALADKGVEMLYISLDRDIFEQRWKDMIKYYNLSGYHVRANTDFSNSLENHFGRFGIPRYLIIGTDGKIINPDAPRPSALEELVKLL
jgi:thiol-disulfide isomerase/thioredoxin